MLDDNEEFANLIGEYLDPILCRGTTKDVCPKSAAVRFTLICPRCLTMHIYTMCDNHAFQIRNTGQLIINNDKESDCDHMDNNKSLVFILTEETVLNGR